MQSAHLVANPFALLLNPAEVVAEMERSERLNRLSSRICRPLDRVQPGTPGADAASDDADLIASTEDTSSRIG